MYFPNKTFHISSKVNIKMIFRESDLILMNHEKVFG